MKSEKYLKSEEYQSSYSKYKNLKEPFEKIIDEVIGRRGCSRVNAAGQAVVLFADYINETLLQGTRPIRVRYY